MRANKFNIFQQNNKRLLEKLTKITLPTTFCNATPWLPTLWKVKANKKEQEAVKHWTPPQCRGHCALCANNPGAWWLIIVVQRVAVEEQRAGAMSTISSSWRSISTHLLIWKKRRGNSVKNGRTWMVTININNRFCYCWCSFSLRLLQVSTATQEVMYRMPWQTKAPDCSLIE